LLLIIIILAIVSIFFYYNSINLSIEKTNNYTYKMMNELNDQINMRLETIIDVSFAIANDDNLKYILREYKKAGPLEQLDYETKIKDIITNFWFNKPEIANINIIVGNKSFISESENGVYPLDKAKQVDWFNALGNKKGILLDTHKHGFESSIKNMFVITALVRIQENSGSDLGFVSVDLSEDYIYQKILAKNKISRNSSIFILNDKGIIISHENKEKIGKKIDGPGYITKIITNKYGKYEQVNIDGKKMLLIYTDINKNKWRIVQLIPVSELYIGFERIRETVLLIAVICILLAIPSALYLSRFITRPITQLAAIMKCFKGDNNRQSIHTEFNNEIKELYNNYNFMMDKIYTLLDDIHNSYEIQRQAEIKALQAQINPHFLYNTLDSINWMALNLNEPDISRAVTMLSRFFRLSLNKGSSTYTVREEIEHVKYYIEIQQICHKNRFEYNLDVEEMVLDYNVPKLILQPLVENSIIHGFEKIMEGGIININVIRNGDVLQMDIIDNGKGIPIEHVTNLFSLESKKGGYGIKNVQERIQFICGMEYGLRYINEETTGTHVRVVLPIVVDPGVIKHR
jgi:Predicted signal transduction protein with a C-terminal ATPase domain